MLMVSARHLDARQFLRSLVAASPSEPSADGQLLERYVKYGDEAAFTALVQRYGPLVLGVCQRVLQHAHDAEDAFQATFIVLARRAASLDGSGSLANWLHSVAYRTAVKARSLAARRQVHERQVEAMPAVEDDPEVLWSDLRPVLDEELERLPEKYRAPLVMCCLQGKSHQEAARELGWPIGSMSRRMSRARELLRQRLTKRGVALSAGLLLFLMSKKARAELVSECLVTQTTQTAVSYGVGQTATVVGSSSRAIQLAREMLRSQLPGHVASGVGRLLLTLFLLLVIGTSATAITYQIRESSRLPSDNGCAGSKRKVTYAP
jgi:RNA polymerase sigma-70 factor (ECF subfamily)